jgi:division protein CdvB (Snf7/Vps24/ESCRT-III family)
LGREEQKAMKECKKLAKENRVSAARILAKEVVNTRKAVERMQVVSLVPYNPFFFYK